MLGGGNLTNGAPSSLSGTGLPKDWWKKLENINVNILGQQGFILNRYTVYELFSDVSSSFLNGSKILIPLSERSPGSEAIL